MSKVALNEGCTKNNNSLKQRLNLREGRKKKLKGYSALIPAIRKLLKRADARRPPDFLFGTEALEVRVARKDLAKAKKIFTEALDCFYEWREDVGRDALWANLGAEFGWYGIMFKEKLP